MNTKKKQQQQEQQQRALQGVEARSVGNEIVAHRGETDWHSFQSKWVIPDQPKNASEMLTCRPGGKPCELRAFRGSQEVWKLTMKHHCTILGSSLSSAHVADSTHSSVLDQHAAVLWMSSGRFAVQ